MNHQNSLYSEKQASKLAERILKQYEHRGIKIEITGGTLKKDRVIFDVKIKGATKESQILNSASDIQLKLGLPLYQPFKKKLSIFIAASEQEIMYESLPKILTDAAYKGAVKKMKLPYVVGHDVMGELVIIDLAEHIHLLIGGSTNSGKTVALKSLILSIISCKSSDKVNLILIDTGANDLTLFEGIPYLSCPVIRDVEKAFGALRMLENEMQRRIDLENTNLSEFKKLPRIVCVIDEYPALIRFVDKQEVKMLNATVSSLLRRGRHNKIHLVIAAQNPTLQNMQCDLGNITARIAFTCAKHSYSTTIIDEPEAEKLLGKGDMLFKSYDGLQRIQGVYIAPNELRKVISGIKFKSYRRPLDYARKFVINDKDLSRIEAGTDGALIGKPVATKQVTDDNLFAQIIMWSLRHDSISCNMIIETFNIGWRKANGFIKRLYSLKIVGELYEKCPRAVLPVRIEDLSVEVIDFLERNGNTKEDIIDALNIKKGRA